RGDSRPRAGNRRGDRRHPGDRRRLGHQVVAVRDRRHAGQPDRRPVPGSDHQAPDLLALLPRRDPARDRAGDEPARPGDRPPLPRRADERELMATEQPRPMLRGDARVRRRRIVNRLAEAGATVAALAAVFVLGIVVWSVAKRGGSELSWGFLTKDLPLFGQPGGGIAPLIVGSALLVGIATAMALPAGVLIAVFLEEFASPRVRAPIQLAVDLLNGLPSIIIGVFVFGLLVYGHPQNGWAGGVGLAIVMLPLITRATQVVLRLVPSSHREGALALGASRWRTV